jgi:hypothetical protein
MLAANDIQASESWSQRLKRQFTPQTWMKLGLVSAGVFAVVMVAITAVEFGAKQPISTLVSSTVSSTSDSNQGAKQQTTLGSILGGTERVSDTDAPDQTDGSAPAEQKSGQDEDGTAGDGSVDQGSTGDGTGTDGSSGTEGSGSSQPDESATDQPTETAPADPAPATDPAVPDAPTDPSTADQGGLPVDSGSDAGTGGTGAGQ